MAAPISHFDDDWLHLGAFRMVSDQRLPQKDRVAAAAAPQLLLDDKDDDLQEMQDSSLSAGETCAFRSMEDLLNDFDEKLSACFRNVHAETESVAPVSEITEDSLLERDEIWNVLSSNYGQVMPVVWKQSRTRSLHIPTFNLEEKSIKSDVTAELSDDEELREQLDMHSIIVSCLAEEPLFTAEQVIEEIEEMMQDSPDLEAEQNPSQSDLSMLSLDIQRSYTNPGYEDSECVPERTCCETNN
ncbi:hypothetical protein PAMP_002388 [Pampus punctatissimus]